MYDIAVIGAGCIGNYLALKLAKSGFKVIVFEKKSEAGINICCTGIISKNCYEILKNNSAIKAIKLNSATIITPDYQKIDFNSNIDIAYIVERSELEKSLAVQAKSNGASIRFSTVVVDLVIKEDRVLINTFNSHEGEQFESEMAVITTGYGPKLPCMSGFGSINNYIIGVQSEVNNIMNDTLEIYLDKNLAPAGFAWLVPTWDNKGLAGLLCKSNPKTYMGRFISLLVSRNKIINSSYQFTHALIPVEPLKRTFTDRILVIGEAAGQVKPLTGGGIYYGILCADIAVETIENAFAQNDFSAAQLSVYQNKWQHLLKKELFIGYKLRYAWEKLSNNSINRFIKTADKLNLITEMNNSDKIYFDWHVKTLSNVLLSFMPFAKNK